MEQHTQAHAQNPLKPVQGEGCFCGNGAGIGGGRQGLHPAVVPSD